MSCMSAMLEYFFEEVWALDRARMEQLCAIVERHWSGEKLAEDRIAEIVAAQRQPTMAEEAHENGGVVMRGGVAVLPVNGVLSKHSSMISRVSVGSSTSMVELRQTFADVRADWEAGRRVHSALFMYDTPGGGVKGVDLVARDIRAARKAGMPIWAYADDTMASGGYFLGSQAERIYANGTATIGSIGVYLPVPKVAEAKVEIIKAGARKAAGHPDVPLSTADREVIQRRVDAVWEAFVEAIHAGRSHRLSLEEIRELADGDVHIATKALELKLIDGIATPEQVVAEMEDKFGGRRPAPRSGGRRMPDKVNVNGGQDGNGTAVADVQGKNGTTDGSGQGGDGGVQKIDDAKLASMTVEQLHALIADVAGKASAQAIEAQAKAAIERREQIATICDGFEHIEEVGEIKASALADPSMSVEKVRDQVLAKVREKSKPDGQVRVGADSREKYVDGFTLALLERSGSVSQVLRGDADRAMRVATAIGYDEPSLALKAIKEARSGGLMGYRLEDIARMTTPGGERLYGDDLCAAAFGHGSSDFPDLLSNLANKTLQAKFAEAKTTYDRWCRVGSTRDFKDQSLLTVSEFANFKDLPEGKTPDQQTVNERKQTIGLLTKGTAISFSRQMLTNDDLGAFVAIPQGLGMAAARLPEDMVFALLNNAHSTAIFGGANFFSAERNNLADAAALSSASLQVAITLMRLQRGFGQDQAELDIEPRFLLVPTALEWTAKQILTSPVKVGGTNNEPNPVAGIVEPIASPRLHRVSETAWYLAADPGTHPVAQVNFLNGRREPFINQVGNGSIQGITYEAIFDCGVALHTPEGGVRNPGS